MATSVISYWHKISLPDFNLLSTITTVSVVIIAHYCHHLNFHCLQAYGLFSLAPFLQTTIIFIYMSYVQKAIIQQTMVLTFGWRSVSCTSSYIYRCYQNIYVHNKTIIIEFGFHFIARVVEVLVCVITLSLLADNVNLGLDYSSTIMPRFTKFLMISAYCTPTFGIKLTSAAPLSTAIAKKQKEQIISYHQINNNYYYYYYYYW